MIEAFDGYQPRLEHLFDMHADLEAPQMLGPTPVGTRQIFIVKGGRFEGPTLKGEHLAGGGDWAIVRPDGAVQVDVRATLKASDGALIYCYYSGLIIGAREAFGRIFRGQDVPLSEYYFFTNPMFQTAASQHEWLNGTMAIGRGRVAIGGVEYRVWGVS